MEKLLNIFFIPSCVFCEAEGSFFCAKCLNKCVTLKNYVAASTYCRKFLSVYEYEGLVRECIRSSKFRNKQFAAMKVLASQAGAKLSATVLKLKTKIGNELVYIPIPVTRKKMIERGFNQAELIAQIFSKAHKISCVSNILIRTKETASQYTQTKKERFENLKNAFAVKNRQAVRGKTVLLVDDICTTGATFYWASKALAQAGAKRVICVALAKKSLCETADTMKLYEEAQRVQTS